MFGVGTLLSDGSHAANGYIALAAQDTNHDGRIDAHDANFSKLVVWVDANHDGKTDAGELKTLADLGITELDLKAQSGSTVDNGNVLGLVSGYKTADGVSHQMADVWLAKDTATSSSTASTSTAPAVSPTDPPHRGHHLHELLAAPQAPLLAGDSPHSSIGVHLPMHHGLRRPDDPEPGAALPLL